MARKRSRSRVKVLTKKRKGSKKKRKRKLKRRHKTDKHSHARRRHAKTQVHGHKRKMLHEAHNTNALLTQFLKMGAGTEDAPYHYDKRHHTKDPEYRWETQERQEFKKGFPAPDVSMLRPQSDNLPPHWGNYPLAAVGHRR